LFRGQAQELRGFRGEKETIKKGKKKHGARENAPGLVEKKLPQSKEGSVLEICPQAATHQKGTGA